jgi:ectoine hydroxylase-related dioxygenase (phytanoyl-CoA dioxygenase family)
LSVRVPNTLPGVPDVTAPESSALKTQFLADGVVCIRGALDLSSLQLAEEAYNWSMAHPTTHHKVEEGGAAKSGGRFYQDFFNPNAMEHYRQMLLESSIADVLARVWGSPDVWFMFEHVFIKEGGESRRTAWHQDSQDLPVEGSDFATAWISFDRIHADEALEFVRGSHWGVRFAAASRSDANDVVRPPVPDIEANRDRYDIVSWPMEPGDVLVFHPAILHGGAPTRVGARRRTLSMRFFGRNAVFAPRPGSSGKVGPSNFGEEELKLKPGDLFRHPAFPRVRPGDGSEIDAAVKIRKAYSPLSYVS